MTYQRTDDGAIMIEIAPFAFLNSRVGERLGLITKRKARALRKQFRKEAGPSVLSPPRAQGD